VVGRWVWLNLKKKIIRKGKVKLQKKKEKKNETMITCVFSTNIGTNFAFVGNEMSQP
jgi:hypothetical protein